MTRRNKVLFSLTRKRIRPAYNKYNVFNTITWRKNVRRGTLYQQIFSAKQETRSYHGEHLTETQFRNIFKSELNSVNPLQSSRSTNSQAEIPWALQTYVGLERRLDTAVFRAMFASSIRQASQFIVRGNVKVNGVKIKQPGYILRPGDMFSVEPERVLEALGRQKPTINQSVELVNKQIKKFNKYIDKCHAKPEVMWKIREKNRKRNSAYYSKYTEKQITRNTNWNNSVRKEMNEKIDSITPVSVLEGILRNEAYFNKHGTLPKEGGKEILGKCLSIYGLVKGVNVNLQSVKEVGESQAEGVKEVESIGTAATTEATEATEATAATTDSNITNIIAEYYPSKDQSGESGPGNKSDVKKLVQDVVKLRQEETRKQFTSKLRDVNSTPETYDPSWVEKLPKKLPFVKSKEAREDLKSVLPIRLPYGHGGLYGLAKPEKGYFTPWTPRQFLTPFAVLPHHIEVSFLTCHAVYLRDPVARPGHSELVSPFPLDMHERAHTYYFARRRKNI